MHLKEVHGSAISSYKTCPRMYYYNYVEGLIPKTESAKLSLGRGVHQALAAYYAALGREMSEKAARAAYDEWAKEMEAVLAMSAIAADDEAAKNIALGGAMLDEYLKFAAQNDDFFPYLVDGKPAIEVSFRAPVWSPTGQRVRGVWHVGTFDGVVQDSRGRLWLLEHKTAKDFPAELSLRLDEQVGFYLLAALQLFGTQPAGVIYNVIRKVDPKRAKTDTVKRWRLVRSGHELFAMRDRLYHAVSTIRRDKVFMPSPGFHCVWKCAYTTLCECDHDGTDATPLKEHFFVKTPDGRRPEIERRLTA